jgi:hypothetical protein
MDIIGLAGNFWGMPVNLTMVQETTPWFNDTAWLSFISGLPAALAALIGLRYVGQKVNEFKVSVIDIKESILHEMNVHNFSVDVTRNDAGAKDAEMPAQRTKEAPEIGFLEAKKIIEKDLAYLEQTAHPREDQALYNIRDRERYDAIIKGLEKLRTDIDVLNQELTNGTVTYKTEIANLQGKIEAKHWWQFWRRG